MKKFQLIQLAEFSEKAYIDELQRVSGLIPDCAITRSGFDAVAHVSSETLKRHFGSWKVALKVAGLEDRYGGGIVTLRMISQTTKHLTDASILDEMKRVAQLVGSPHLTQDVFKKNSVIHPTTIFRRFGSWRKACCEAGLDLSPRTVRFSDLECFENLLKLWTYYGRPPVGREAEILPSTVGRKAYLNRWAHGVEHLPLSYFGQTVPMLSYRAPLSRMAKRCAKCLHGQMK